MCKGQQQQIYLPKPGQDICMTVNSPNSVLVYAWAPICSPYVTTPLLSLTGSFLSRTGHFSGAPFSHSCSTSGLCNLLQQVRIRHYFIPSAHGRTQTLSSGLINHSFMCAGYILTGSGAVPRSFPRAATRGRPRLTDGHGERQMFM